MEDKENLRHVAHYPIKSGPRTYKSVNVFEIKASSSGKKIVSFWKAEKDRYELNVVEERKFECQPDELEKLVALIDNIEEVTDLDRGDYIFLKKDSPSAEAATAAINSIQSADSAEAERLAALLIESVGKVEKDIHDFEEFSDNVSDDIFKVENLVGYARTERAVNKFKGLIQENAVEDEYQDFLEEHPWLFGNRYIEPTENREFTRDEEVDFCLETIDGYYDIFEIKRPGHEVMNYDSSHDTYYPSHRLSKAVAQTENYIKEIEANHGDILRRDGLDLLKPRGTIVIGSDLGSDEKEGLRVFNSYLNRVRVRTYTDIASMGERLLEMYDENSDLQDQS
ncbi:Shedu anti-phage system protein SduA domain-containing protein [Natronobacterium lacisalsi]|uniref:Shedu anti-phage system protein SduA domain-containing protein n=1 Tax=Natronobacterium lacisalsi TaxID=229731 RepID=UPI00135F1B45|nr:Shedu anti-phage system protein SduA domain-containing protein [Halobiforma lacisalsi]